MIPLRVHSTKHLLAAWPVGCLGEFSFNRLLHVVALLSALGCIPCGLPASLHAASVPLLSSLAVPFRT